MIEDIKFLQERQKKFLQVVGNDGIAILFAARDLPHHRKTISIYRQDSDFFYLTGFNEPQAVAVLAPHHPEHRFVLFVLEEEVMLIILQIQEVVVDLLG